MKSRPPGKYRKPATNASSQKAKKIAIDFPPALFQETERVAHELSINRSTLIRSAVELYLRARRREKLEEEIAASFAANTQLDRQLVNEFAHVDAEIDL